MNGMLIQSEIKFDLFNTFENGQCFRWYPVNDTYRGVVRDTFVEIRKVEGGLMVETLAGTELDEAFWRNYLTLDADYKDACDRLMQKDEHLNKAVSQYPGLHLLRQDFEEMVISFIISANNNVGRIKKIIKKLSEEYGEYIGEGEYAFPSMDKLAGASVDKIRECGAGYRSEYIIKSANRYIDSGMNADVLLSGTYKQAKDVLLQYSGVGPKVADCILLFSGIKTECFPTDVWIKRIMEILYFEEEVSPATVTEFAVKYFGKDAGLAQQFLFHYARQNKIGVTP